MQDGNVLKSRVILLEYKHTKPEILTLYEPFCANCLEIREVRGFGKKLLGNRLQPIALRSLISDNFWLRY